MIKAVLFDYGGVVAGDVRGFHVTDSVGQRVQGDPSIERAAKVWGFSYDKVMEGIEGDLGKLVRGQIREKEMWERFALAAGVVVLPSGYEALTGLGFAEIYPENEEVVSLIYELQGRGIVTGVLSNTVHTHAAINKGLGRYEKFDPVILSFEVGTKKPEERIYQVGVEKLAEKGISPKECVYIDDVAKYLEPAASLGMKTIHFRNGEHSVSYLREQLERIVK